MISQVLTEHILCTKRILDVEGSSVNKSGEPLHLPEIREKANWRIKKHPVITAQEHWPEATKGGWRECSEKLKFRRRRYLS